MKRRLIVSAVLLATALCASGASAASTTPIEPTIGKWAASESYSDQSASFRLVNVSTHYLAYSLSSLVHVECLEGGPGGALHTETLRTRGVKVRLDRKGSGLAGSKTISAKKGKTKATVVVKIAVTSARRAKVTLSARKVNPGNPACKGSVKLTAKPR